jgi:serine/threonine protein kinase
MEFAENRSLACVLDHVSGGAAPSFWNPTGKAIIICGIVLGMRLVHSKGYIHRDLKPGNILIGANGRSLIADFGIACYESADTTLTPEVGLAAYSAPEMFFEGPYTAKVDVFSFGSIFYEILTEKRVFPMGFPLLPLRRMLLDGEMPPIPGEYGRRMQELIRRCWSPSPDSRPSFQSILEAFVDAEFDIVPDSHPVVVREYVDGVCRWERECRFE